MAQASLTNAPIPLVIVSVIVGHGNHEADSRPLAFQYDFQDTGQAGWAHNTAIVYVELASRRRRWSTWFLLISCTGYPW
jgi:hypothetical protein